MYKVYMDGVLMPVTPGKIEIKVKNKNKSKELLDIGEVNHLKPAGLSEIKFDVLLPMVQYPFAVYESGFKTAEYYLEVLERLKSGQKPFRFVVSRIAPNGDRWFGTNIKVSLEDYTITEDAKKHGLDVYVKVKLKLYRDFGTKILKLSSDGKTATLSDGRESKDISEFYTVQENETVFDIAMRELDDESKYTYLMDINGLDSIFDIEVGQVIRLV